MTPTYDTLIAIGYETAYNTPPIDGNFVLLPVNSFNAVDPREQILDQGFRGLAAMDHAIFQGVGHSEISMEIESFPDEIGFLLAAILGDPVTSGAGPFDHIFTVANVPNSLSIQEQGLPEDKRRSGCRVGSLNFRFSGAEGLLIATAELQGQVGASGATLAPTDATEDPWRGWQASIEMPNATPITRIVDMEINMTRVLDLIHTARNSQDPLRIDSGRLEITGTMTLDFINEADRALYEAKTQQSLEVTLSYGSGAAQREIIFLMGNVDVGEGPFEVDRGAEHLTAVLNWRAMHNAAESGPIQVSLKNSLADYA